MGFPLLPGGFFVARVLRQRQEAQGAALLTPVNFLTTLVWEAAGLEYLEGMEPSAAQSSVATNARLQRERATIAAMYRIYCRQEHGADTTLCAECQRDLDYCLRRIDKCPYGEHKPTCKNCVTHCYSPTMQQRVRAVMRLAGPQMLRHHPLLALLHLLWDARKKPGRPPPEPGKRPAGEAPKPAA